VAGANAHVVARGLEAFARRDIPDWLGCFDPEVEVREDPSVPDAGGYHGHGGLLQWMHVMESNWDEFHVSAERLVESGDDVVALHSVTGRGRESGVEVNGRFASIFTLRDGRVVRWTIFAGWGPALEAAGLGG
jgi:ketosteroid isomerase-like protein